MTQHDSVYKIYFAQLITDNTLSLPSHLVRLLSSTKCAPSHWSCHSVSYKRRL